MTVDRVLATLRISRLHVGLLAAMYTVLGAYLSSSAWLHRPDDVIHGAVVIALVVAFGFVINDYHDSDLDSISKPYRPIPSGRLSRRYALGLACGLALFAVVAAAGMGVLPVIAALALVACSAAYTYFLKPTLLLGIMTVALLNAAAVLYGCMAAGGMSPGAIMLTVLAVLNAGAQETLYNVVDRADDARFHVHTTAVRLGQDASLWLFTALALGCAAATIVPWSLHLGSHIYIWAALPCSTIPLVGVVVLVRTRSTLDTLYLAHRIMKLVRLASVLPVLLLR